MVKSGTLEINPRIRIPDTELRWTFVRSSGPGGQNVNKVASRAVLRWNLFQSPHVPDDVKQRLRSQHRRRISAEGDLILSCQRFRDQGRNIDECLEKLRQLLLAAAVVPTPRKATRPTRASRRARLQAKRRRTGIKRGRRPPGEE